MLEHGEVEPWKTLTANVRGGVRGVPEDWRRGAELARSFAPELVITDFDGFAYLFAKSHRLPVICVDNIQMVDRCRHDAEILRGIHSDYLDGASVRRREAPAGRPLPDHDLLPPADPQEAHDARPLDPPTRDPRGAARVAASTCSSTGGSARRRRPRSRRAASRAASTARATASRPTRRTATCATGRSRTRRSSTTCAPRRGVVGSAGYSLMSEAVYLRKPMLALPLAGQFEQEMNARYLERLGFGTAATALDEAALERFLDGEPEHDEALAGYEQDGNTEALEAVDRVIDELAAARRA